MAIKKPLQPTSAKSKTVGQDMMEKSKISPWYSLGKILPTSNQTKEDAFESFVPTKQCVDYKISETWVKMQKGDLKLNYKETVATYKDIPPEICKPKKSKKMKYFSGGPPQFEFLEEVWQRLLEQKQIVARKEHKLSCKAVRKERMKVRKKGHLIVQNLVGPDWFMELNPLQIAAVDKLEEAVCCDLFQTSTEHCKEVLGNLGLVPRPNQSHLKKALKHSCGDPVEFLLVFYQLLDPSRTNYSLNDRLLLSAVVHLSITATLRELHVRIPSPPRIRTTKPQTIRKRQKSIKNQSPYLQPLTYQPPPPKFNGVYTNKHRQYPESPYFGYIVSMEIERRSADCSKRSECYKDTEDYLKEYRAASQYFDSLPGNQDRNFHLIPPTVLKLCYNMLNRKNRPALDSRFIIPHLCKVSPSEELQCFCPPPSVVVTKQKIGRSVCEKFAQKYLGSLCFCNDCIEQVRLKNLVRIHGGWQATPCKCECPVPIIQGTTLSEMCECYRAYRDKIVLAAAMQRFTDEKCKTILGNVVMTKFGPVYHVTGIPGKKICLCSEVLERKKQLEDCREALLNNGAEFVIGGVTLTKIGVVYSLVSVVARKPCQCVLQYREKLQVLELQNKLRTQPITFVNNGLIQRESEIIFHLSGVTTAGVSGFPAVCSCDIVKPDCFSHCMNYLEYKESESLTSSSDDEDSATSISEEEHSSSTVETSEVPLCIPDCTNNDTSPNSKAPSSSETVKSTESDLKSKQCRCKEELDRFLNSKCLCEECNQTIRQGYATHVMGGTTTTPSGNQINVVQGIHQPLCSCMHDHLTTLKKLDEYKQRVTTRYRMKKQPLKYCISGVTKTKQGPVYVISGLRPPVECECAKAQKEQAEAEALERQRAKLPNTGRIKYEIKGVKAMPDENVYVMSAALPTTPCGCEKLLEKFEKAHETCLDEFQKYMEVTEMEKVALYDETPDGSNRGTLLFSEDFNPIEEFQQELPPPEEEFISPNNEILTQQHYDDQTIQTEPTVIEHQQENVAPVEFSSSLVSSTSTSEESSTESEDSDTASCHVSIPRPVKPILLSGKDPLPDCFQSKRFAIFRDTPKSTKSLMDVLKRILKGMAEDGFPLAKLPQVEKLPIIKLWLEMRIGRYWTYTDKAKSVTQSKTWWKHTDVCYTQSKPTRMPYTNAKARTMTWRSAKQIRKVAAQQTDEFYRNVKQQTVETGREFFATTFAYQFPTHTWRDCAFAYLPTKEENLFPYKIVQPHDARYIPNNKKIVCFC